VLFNLGPFELVVIGVAFAVLVGGPIVATAVLAWLRRRRDR
jgi:hypothetical protein